MWPIIGILYLATTSCASVPWDYGLDKHGINRVADCYIPYKNLGPAKIIEVIDNGL